MGIYKIADQADQIVERKTPEWLAQGDIQGFARGSHEKARETAMAFLAMGLSAQQGQRVRGCH